MFAGGRIRRLGLGSNNSLSDQGTVAVSLLFRDGRDVLCFGRTNDRGYLVVWLVMDPVLLPIPLVESSSVGHCEFPDLLVAEGGGRAVVFCSVEFLGSRAWGGRRRCWFEMAASPAAVPT